MDDPKHGFSEAALAAVMAAFDTHPEAGSKSPHARRRCACAGLRGLSL
nr:N-hydroxyarylamine O-acetyltransferase [Klebsiella pneumoniae]